MNKIIYILSMLCILTGEVLGQASYKKLIDAGDDAFEDGKYYAAMRYYSDALERDDGDVSLWYRYGQAAKNQHSYDRAREAYAHVVAMQGAAEYPDALYDLATLSVTAENYTDAEKYYQQYLDDFGGEDGDLDERASMGLESAQWAQEQVDKPVRNSTHLGREVNSPYSEHSPIWQNDELNFVSLRYGQEDQGGLLSKVLYLKDSTSQPLPLAANFNENGYLTSDPSYSSDDEFMFYTKCEYDENEEIKCKIYYRKKSDDKYTLGVNSGNLVNLDGSTNTHPTLVEYDDKIFLYFASDRPGGKGGYDIWYSELNDNMLFSAPRNAEEINTKYNEITPHFQSSSNTLYFSTDGRLGFGGYDVYMAKLGEDMTFQDFENMGLSVNSSYHDLHFFESDDGQHAYLSSNRKGSFYSDDSFETCCYDIYEVEPKRCEIDLTVLIYDALDSTQLIGSNILIQDKETEEEVYTKYLEDTHMAETYLDCIKDYKITVDKDDYLPGYMDLMYSEEGLKLNGSSDTVEIYLVPAVVTLDLRVYDLETKEELNEATLVLIEEPTGIPVEKFNADGNDFVFSVLPGKTYQLKATRPGYIPSESEIVIPSGEKVVEREVFLKKTPIEKKIVTLKEVLPIRLFFDNDRPNPKSMDTTTTIQYADTYEPYYAKKDKFKKIYSSKFAAQNKDEARQRVEDFFEGELRRNHQNLNKFMSTLLEVLEAGRTVNLYFRGYASPLSVSEYNFNLGKRRVESMLLELKNFGGGIFLSYIDNGQIILTERSFGETSAPTGVSDDFSDVSGSIFSPEASFERRVEIQEIEVNREQ